MKVTRKLVARYGHTFTGRAGIVFAGSVLGQAIAFILLPLIAQIYDASILGQAATVLAIVSISALVVCLQYDQAVVVAPDTDIPYLLLLGTSIAVAWFVLLSSLIFIDSHVEVFNQRALLASWGVNWILPALVLAYGLFTLLINLGLRQNKLLKVSVGRSVYYGGSSLLQVIGGLVFGASATVFLLAQFIGALAAVLCLMPYRQVFAWIQRRCTSRDISFNMLRVAKVYVKFPKFQMGAGFINAVSIYMPVIFMRAVFSDAWAGWYYMAWRLLAAPVTLIAQAVGQVFYRDSAERERAGVEQSRLVENVVTGLMRLSVLPATAVGIAAPLIIDLLLGDGWQPVAAIIQVLLITMTVSFFTSPVSMLLNVKGLQMGALRYAITISIVRLLGLTLGWRLQSEMISVWAYSVFGAVVLLFYLNYIVSSVGGSFRVILQNVKFLLVDLSLLLVLTIVLWMAGVLYQPIGILTISLGLVMALWRDIRRGGWRGDRAGSQLSPEIV